jgi:hypothetical protein
MEWAFEWGLATAPYRLQLCRRNGQTIVVDPATNAVTAGTGPDGTFCLSYKNRMWVFNTMSPVLGQECRFFWSASGNTTNWAAPSGGWVDIQPGDGQFLVSAIVYNDTLWIFKNRSIWTMTVDDDPIDAVPRLLHDSIGCIGRGTVQYVEGFLYFLSAEGVYRTDGTTFEEISEPIRNSFVTRPFFSRDDVLRTQAVYWDNKYILSFGKQDADYLWVFDVVTETWTKWKVSIGTVAFAGMATYSEAEGDYLLLGSGLTIAGSTNGWLFLTRVDSTWYRDDTTGQSGGGDSNNYVAIAKLGTIDNDVPGQYKRNHYNALDVESTASQNIQVVDAERTPTADHTKRLPDTERRYVAFPGAGKYRHKSLDITATTVSGETPGALKIFSVITADSTREPAHRLSGSAN